MADYGAGAKGALTGAATGAAVGSVVPGVGTAIGAGVGGLVGGLGGLFGSSGPDPSAMQYADRNRILSLINRGYAPGGIANGKTYTANGAQLDMGNDQFRAGQIAQVGQLQRIASGQTQGAGELAAQRQAAAANAAQQAMARMARGGNAALAYRTAANQTAANGVNAAGQAQQAALQDQANAQSALANTLGNARGQDIGVAGQNAQLAQQINMANAQARAQQQQLNAQNYMGLLQQLSGMDAGQLAGAQQAAIANQQMNQAILGAGIGAAGQILGARINGGSGGG